MAAVTVGVWWAFARAFAGRLWVVGGVAIWGWGMGSGFVRMRKVIGIVALVRWIFSLSSRPRRLTIPSR